MSALARMGRLSRAMREAAARNKISLYYPDTGPLRRELYPRHMAFFALGGQHEPMVGMCPPGCAGAPHRQRLAMCANRTGKTEGMGGYEVTMHATGQYPAWWRGYRFAGPIEAWAVGETTKATMDTQQRKLLGPSGAYGTGLIPHSALVATEPKRGLTGAVETISVRHVTGGISRIAFKSYDQDPATFAGVERDLIWLDELVPHRHYAECLARTMRTQWFPGGMVILTFTPLSGASDVVMEFLPDGDVLGRIANATVTCSWEDVPHLSDEDRAEMRKAIPAFQLDARSKGLPRLGSGAIYPVPEEDIVVAPFPIPDHWRRVYALDVGWKRTACLWMALDPESMVWYGYSEHYGAAAEPAIHAEAIRARGDWIPGVIDPAARGRTQGDGQRLSDMYRDLGLELAPAKNAVEAGLYLCWQMLSAGQIKIFSNLENFRREFRLYSRDANGAVKKEHDHLMDCMRYAMMSGREAAATKPVPKSAVYLGRTGWG